MCNHINGPTVSRHSIKCTIDHAHPKSIDFVTKRIYVCHPSTNIPCGQKMSNVAIEIGTPVSLEGVQDSAWGGQSSIGVSAGPNKYFGDLDCNVFISIQRSDLVKKSGNIIGDCRQVTSLALIKCVITFEIHFNGFATCPGNKILIKGDGGRCGWSLAKNSHRQFHHLVIVHDELRSFFSDHKISFPGRKVS